MHTHPYWAKNIAVAAKYQEERVMRPPFLMQLGAGLIVAEASNTKSAYGQSSSVSRPIDSYDTARTSAEEAMASTGLSLGLACEHLFAARSKGTRRAWHYARMLFFDRQRPRSIVETVVTSHTNYGRVHVRRLAEAEPFLRDSLFPSHGMVVSSLPDDPTHLLSIEGITSYAALEKAVRLCLQHSKDGRVHIETDMRPHMNPTCQLTLQQLAQKLARRLRQLCVVCGAPGWGVLEEPSDSWLAKGIRPQGRRRSIKMGCVQCGTVALGHPRMESAAAFSGRVAKVMGHDPN